MSTARVFIGSSVEGLCYARAVQAQLLYDSEIDAQVWAEVFQEPLRATVEALEALREFDFAVFVLTADDVLETRGERHRVPRDNLIYEMGLAVAELGRSRVFPMQPYGEDLRKPSDLAGTNPIHFRAQIGDEDPTAQDCRHGVAPACETIRDLVRRLGPRAKEDGGERDVAEGVSLEGHLSSISGRVANGSSSGLGGASLTLLAWDKTKERWTPAAGAITDAQGTYHFHSLPFGSYLVRADVMPEYTILRGIQADGSLITTTPVLETDITARALGPLDGAAAAPAWDYQSGVATNLGDTDFAFLVENCWIEGIVRRGGASPVDVQVVVSLRGATHPSPHIYRLELDDQGRYALTGILEGLYDITVMTVEDDPRRLAHQSRVVMREARSVQVDFHLPAEEG